jgi:hypothetical protein
MPPSPTWLQRMPPELERRIDRAEATAREAITRVHAELALQMVAILAPRMPFDTAIERYLESMRLEGKEKEAVGTRAVALMDREHVEEDVQREGQRSRGWSWRYATPPGVLRYIRRQIKRSDEEELWLELAAARAEEVLVEAHLDHALGFVALMEENSHADPTRAVALYLERLEVPELRARIVYQRVLARLAQSMLPRLPSP